MAEELADELVHTLGLVESCDFCPNILDSQGFSSKSKVFLSDDEVLSDLQKHSSSSDLFDSFSKEEDIYDEPSLILPRQIHNHKDRGFRLFVYLCGNLHTSSELLISSDVSSVSASLGLLHEVCQRLLKQSPMFIHGLLQSLKQCCDAHFSLLQMHGLINDECLKSLNNNNNNASNKKGSNHHPSSSPDLSDSQCSLSCQEWLEIKAYSGDKMGISAAAAEIIESSTHPTTPMSSGLLSVSLLMQSLKGVNLWWNIILGVLYSQLRSSLEKEKQKSENKQKKKKKSDIKKTFKSSSSTNEDHFETTKEEKTEEQIEEEESSLEYFKREHWEITPQISSISSTTTTNTNTIINNTAESLLSYALKLLLVCNAHKSSFFPIRKILRFVQWFVRGLLADGVAAASVSQSDSSSSIQSDTIEESSVMITSDSSKEMESKKKTNKKKKSVPLMKTKVRSHWECLESRMRTYRAVAALKVLRKEYSCPMAVVSDELSDDSLLRSPSMDKKGRRTKTFGDEIESLKESSLSSSSMLSMSENLRKNDEFVWLPSVDSLTSEVPGSLLRSCQALLRDCCVCPSRESDESLLGGGATVSSTLSSSVTDDDSVVSDATKDSKGETESPLTVIDEEQQRRLQRFSESSQWLYATLCGYIGPSVSAAAAGAAGAGAGAAKGAAGGIDSKSKSKFKAKGSVSTTHSDDRKNGATSVTIPVLLSMSDVVSMLTSVLLSTVDSDHRTMDLDWEFLMPQCLIPDPMSESGSLVTVEESKEDDTTGSQLGDPPEPSPMIHSTSHISSESGTISHPARLTIFEFEVRRQCAAIIDAVTKLVYDMLVLFDECYRLESLQKYGNHSRVSSENHKYSTSMMKKKEQKNNLTSNLIPTPLPFIHLSNCLTESNYALACLRVICDPKSGMHSTTVMPCNELSKISGFSMLFAKSLIQFDNEMELMESVFHSESTVLERLGDPSYSFQSRQTNHNHALLLNLCVMIVRFQRLYLGSNMLCQLICDSMLTRMIERLFLMDRDGSLIESDDLSDLFSDRQNDCRFQAIILCDLLMDFCEESYHFKTKMYHLRSLLWSTLNDDSNSDDDSSSLDLFDTFDLNRCIQPRNQSEYRKMIGLDCTKLASCFDSGLRNNDAEISSYLRTWDVHRRLGGSIPEFVLFRNIGAVSCLEALDERAIHSGTEASTESWMMIESLCMNNDCDLIDNCVIEMSDPLAMRLRLDRCLTSFAFYLIHRYNQNNDDDRMMKMDQQSSMKDAMIKGDIIKRVDSSMDPSISLSMMNDEEDKHKHKDDDDGYSVVKGTRSSLMRMRDKKTHVRSVDASLDSLLSVLETGVGLSGHAKEVDLEQVLWEELHTQTLVDIPTLAAASASE